MRSPNFFIVGAPKCGTTSLAFWLSEHSRIYMPPLKEPNFYGSDLALARPVSDALEYRRLFGGARPDHIAIGEASATYLLSAVAVPAIEADVVEAHYVVMIRNPLDMAQSLHGWMNLLGQEHISDFETAWRLSSERRQGREVVRGCLEPRLLDYQCACQLGHWVELLLRNVPAERVLITVLDDISKNPRDEYLRVLEFLDVPDDGRSDFPAMNTYRVTRSPLAARLLRSTARLSTAVKRRLGIPIYRGSGILSTLEKRVNGKAAPRPVFSAEFRRELVEYYQSDILYLSSLLRRDLSAWMEA